MLRSEFFISAMKAGMFKKLNWVISAFAKVAEGENDWKKKPYAGRIVQHHTGTYFINEQSEMVKLEDTSDNSAPYKFKDKLTIKSGDIPNYDGPELETTYGNLICNWLILVHPFGNKIPYVKDKFDLGGIESIILKRLKDNPKPGDPWDDKEIYVRDYLKYVMAMDYLPGMTQLCVWGATEKTILPPPGIAEFKAKLLKENEGHLHELATIAKIDAQLVEYDAEWLKGDPGENFLLGSKARKVVRKKKHLMHGAEVGMVENAVTGTLIANSLSEGWDISKFPEMNTSLRSGSFDRGAQTAFGGVTVKWLLRASNNLRITERDCGSKIGVWLDVRSPADYKYLIGRTAIDDESGDKQTLVTDESVAGAYLGKRIQVRSPMYCTLSHTDYCVACLGEKLSVNPYGLSTAISEVGSTFLSIFMKKMHGTQLATADAVLEDIFS